MKSRKSRRNHQNEYEKARNMERMEGFDERESYAYNKLCERYGPKPSQHELLSLAQVISENLDILLDREAFRRKRVLIKWFDENFTKIEPFWENYIVVIDENGDPIGNDPRSRAVSGK